VHQTCDGDTHTLFRPPSPPYQQYLQLLGIVGPQLSQIHRPFDKARQQLRKLATSLQAGVLLPHDTALAALAARLHHGRLALEAYDQTEEEQGLCTVLQAHCLVIWDVLHQFGLNHFGRLIHVPQAPVPDQPGANPQGGLGKQHGVGPVPPMYTVPGSAAVGGSTSSTPGSPASLPSAYPSPRSAFPSPPFSSPRSVYPSPRAPVAPEACPYAQPTDPLQHDWDEIELAVAETERQTLGLGGEGDRRRSEAALEVMAHVAKCITAQRYVSRLC
jgi:hypothetical protein